MVDGSAPEVRRAAIADLDPVARVLGEAFADYPWTRWTVDARDHAARIEALQRLALERIGLPYGEVWVALIDGSVEAAAVWMDSRTPPPASAWREMADEQRALEGDRHAASQAAEAVAASLRPSTPHVLLATVGTRTGARRRGLGRAVIAPGLALADTSRMVAYLETSSRDNVGFYRSVGFEVLDEVQIQDGPSVWAMGRDPAIERWRPIRR